MWYSQFSAKVNGANPGAIVGGIFSCLLILALVGWVGYAYFNPNTSSGRFLIKVITKKDGGRCVLRWISFSSVSSWSLEVEAIRRTIHCRLDPHVALPLRQEGHHHPDHQRHQPLPYNHNHHRYSPAKWEKWQLHWARERGQNRSNLALWESTVRFNQPPTMQGPAIPAIGNLGQVNIEESR